MKREAYRVELIYGDQNISFKTTEGIDSAKNAIMYSGHLLQMVGLREMLFDDYRYDEPGSLPFRFAPVEYPCRPGVG